MSKKNETYLCSNCEHRVVKWTGKCLSCGQWNSYISEVEFNKTKIRKFEDTKIVKLSNISLTKYQRIKTNITEFDKVMGGGIVPGSLTLLCGAPGVGKSTLVMKVLDKLIASRKILYISGEESSQQILRRTKRLRHNLDELYISSEKCWIKVKDQIDIIKPDLIVIDSIQTISNTELSSQAGSVTQIKEVTSQVMSHVKEKSITCIIIGHVTKDGGIAGPKVLEHMVDTVIFFELANDENKRLIRVIKNRFGDTREVGLFKMTETELKEDLDDDDPLMKTSKVGESKCLIQYGKRAVVSKVETLINDNKNSHIKRITKGLDSNRVIMLLAVLEKNLKISFEFKDIFIKQSKYFKSDHSDMDLSIVSSLYSSYANKKIKCDKAFLGEVALTGEVNPVNNLKYRINELKNRGFKQVVTNSNGLLVEGISIIDIKDIKDMPSVI
jgi:DNA repair protein RadA/Sms